MTIVLLLLLLLAAAVATAVIDDEVPPIPCPGADTSYPMDPHAFALSMPLHKRPTLAKILQFGYQPYRQQAVLPQRGSTHRAHQIHLAQGFHPHRSFRRLAPLSNESSTASSSSSSCPYVSCTKSFRSGASNSPIHGLHFYDHDDGFADLLQQQLLLQVGVTSLHHYPDSVETFAANPSWQAWSQAMVDFAATDRNCSFSSEESFPLRMLHVYAYDYECSVEPSCVQLDTEFVNDLIRLPNTWPPPSQTDYDAQNNRPFVEFIQKWGYGTVNEFALGAAELFLMNGYSLNPQNNKIVLSMGRGGGKGNDLIPRVVHGQNNIRTQYTKDDCRDPEPIGLQYEPWHDLLWKDASFRALEEQGILVNRTGLIGRFSRAMEDILRRDHDCYYSSVHCDFDPNVVSEQIAVSNVTTNLEDCVPGTRNPTLAPSTAGPSSSSTSTPTLRPSDRSTLHTTLPTSQTDDDTMTLPNDATSSPTDPDSLSDSPTLRDATSSGWSCFGCYASLSFAFVAMLVAFVATIA